MSKNSSSKLITKATPSTRVALVLFNVVGTLGIFFTGQFLGVYLLIIALSLLGNDHQQITRLLSDNIYVQFFAVALIAVITFGILYFVHKYRKVSLRDSLGLKGRPNGSTVWSALITYGLYFLAFLFMVAVVSYIVPSLNINQEQSLGFKSPVGFEVPLVFLSLVIIPSVLEEAVFRGFLYRRLRAVIGIPTAAIITSLIFGSAHLEFLDGGSLNYIAALDTLLLSFFLIWLVEKTDNIWASIFLHGLKNTIAFVVLFII